MFGKSKISKSMIDAVNSVIGEEPVVENKKMTTMLSEKEQITPETLKGQILKKKDDKKASLGKSAIAMSAEEVEAIDEKNWIAGAIKKPGAETAAAKRAGMGVQAYAHKHAHDSGTAGKRARLAITLNKLHHEDVELDEEGNCVTPMKAKKIADKEVGKHEKEMHKESKSFKERLLEKSTSEKQARTMAAAAHNPAFAKKVGIPQSVAKDFNKADKGTKQLSNAMKKEETEQLDEIGDNSALYNQSAKTSAAKLNALKSSQKTFDFEKKQGLKAKANMTHEETEVTESLKDVAKKVLSKVGHPDDKGMRKDLQKKVGVPQTGEKPMKKEEVESLDELSKDTLTSYGNKAAAQAHTLDAHLEFGRYTKKGKEALANKMAKRNAGVASAEKRLSKEEVEGLEEMDTQSHSTYGSRDGHNIKGPDLTAKSTTPKKVVAKGTDILNRAFKNADDGRKQQFRATGHGGMPPTQEEVESVDENAFTDYKTDKKPSIFSPKSHTAKKTEKGTMYTKNWSKKDMEHKDDDKMKKEAVDKEAEQHVRVDGETDMKTKTVDGLRGRMKVPADYHNKTKSYKVAMPVGEETEHDDEAEDKALVKKMVKKDALKKTDEAFKGPEAGSGVGDHPFVTAEAKPLKNARELAKNTMHRLKNEMLGKLAN